MYEPRFFTPTPLGMACCKLFTAALAAAIAGDNSSHDKGPVGLGRSRGAVLKYLKIDIMTVERESETAVSMRVLAHVQFLIIVREQKIQRIEIHSGRKYSTKKFSPLTSTGEIGENFLLAKILSYTVVSMTRPSFTFLGDLRRD